MQHITILERDPIIAEDIRDTMAALFPDAVIDVHDELRAFCDALAARAAPNGLAIVHATTGELRDPELARILTARDVRTVAIRAPLADAAFANWVFLTPPFTTPDLQAAALRAIRRI
ncbi:MAG: hypothetical protein AAFQ39_03155 [Pseudomonadota bacterium]